MTRPPHVLLVEDDAPLAGAVVIALEREGYRVTHRLTGEEGLETALAEAPDCVILDIGLPGIDGLEVLRRLKASRPRIPVVLASGRDEEFDRVLGLEVGGDDYVTKPFYLRELVARVKARLRGSRPAPVRDGREDEIVLGDRRVDLRRRLVHAAGGDERLTTIECALLEYLVERSGHDVSRQDLLEDVWGEDDSLTPRKVDNVVKKLRAKVEANPAEPRYILTVHGKGYRFEP